MKCFLHIGTEKTATTTLQEFLDLNRDKFLQQGFIFTKSAGMTDDRKLSVAAYDLERRDGFTKSHRIYSSHDLANFQQRVIHELSDEIKGLVEDKSDLKIIFSSEHFHSRLTQLNEIQHLKEILSGFGIDEVSVIVYLRNPAEIASSLFSTAIKSGTIDKLPPSPGNQYYSRICHHQHTIEKIASVFGEAAIIPRLFHTSALKNGSIIDDFLDVIGLSADKCYCVPDDANKSISVLGIQLLRRINEIIPRFIEDKPNPLRADIVSYIEYHFSDCKYVMPDKLVKQYDAAFHPSNEWVRKKYFPNRQTLFPVTAAQKETKLNLSAIELDNIASIIASIWLDKQRGR